MIKNVSLLLLLSSILLVSCESLEEKNARIELLKEKERQEQLAYEKSLLTVKIASISRGHGFHQTLNYLSIDAKTANQIINGLRDEVEFSKLRVGDQVIATFDKEMKLISFEYSQNPAEKHKLTFNNETQSWDYQLIQEQTQWVTRIITGELNPGSTLQSDLIAEGLQRSVVAEVINVLLCKVHFRTDARKGDQYKILLKERIFQDQILETKILYTSYNGKRAGHSEAFFYDDGSEKSTFTAHYTEDGEALIRSGLRYPVGRLHIRSGFGKRRHPVTGEFAMHRGVDLTGRVGDSVHAVAHGRVVESTYDEISGNKIAIKHSDNSVSYYLHLNSRSVKVGDVVKSYQVIGALGGTGRVTGPHLHFGFKNTAGSWINPMSKRMIATPKLVGERYTKLTEQIKQTKALIQNIETEKLSRYVVQPKINNT